MNCGVPIARPAIVTNSSASSRRAERTIVCSFASGRQVRTVTEGFRQTPIHHNDFSVSAEHDVVRLQIAMHHTLGMRIRDGIAHLLENGEQFAEWIPALKDRTRVPQ
jgi:hypothetical protein